MNKRITMADIARLAGVSPSTVSRALNNSPTIPEVTRARIQRIVAEQHYELDTRAQNFRLQRSKTIATVFPYVGASQRLISDPFYLEMLAGITNELAAYDYDMILARVPSSDDRWSRRAILNNRVDGILYIDRALEDRNLETLHALGAHVVIWGPPLDRQSYTCVGCNSVQGAAMAVRHLVGLGRRRIGFIGGSQHMVETDLRRRGYEQALTQCGFDIDPHLIAYTDFSPQAGSSAMHDLLNRAPDLDAVFLCSDYMAITAIEVLRARGRRVPEDVSIVGYDDITLAAHSNPRLTTVRQPIETGGRLLVRKLFSLINDTPTESAILPFELVIRDSCGASMT